MISSSFSCDAPSALLAARAAAGIAALQRAAPSAQLNAAGQDLAQALERLAEERLIEPLLKAALHATFGGNTEPEFRARLLAFATELRTASPRTPESALAKTCACCIALSDNVAATSRRLSRRRRPPYVRQVVA